MFTTTVNKRSADIASYCFTLEGLLKSQEHEGYACADARPAGMKDDFPGLFPFQRSTVKWMLDAEQGPDINRCGSHLGVSLRSVGFHFLDPIAFQVPYIMQVVAAV